VNIVSTGPDLVLGLLSLLTPRVPLIDVDEVEYELAPKAKRPRIPGNPYVGEGSGNANVGDDTGAEANNEKRECETEDQASLNGLNYQEVIDGDDVVRTQKTTDEGAESSGVGGGSASTTRRRKMLVARPFGTMKGHTAFLTFASAGNKMVPNPN